MSGPSFRTSGTAGLPLDNEYDYQAPTPTQASSEGLAQMQAYQSPGKVPESAPATMSPQGEAKGGEEALLDLAQLEELQQEAERMKALGNKHMAAQEYARAYNAYSAALQLAPVGPSSHVFLSNRAAALLSLKRYGSAATDARRAIALAPTFGKAHARLGQALYFLRDYAGAVSAYQDALEYEPENPVTRTYLEKARNKWEKAQRKEAESVSGDTQMTPSHSVATDPASSEKHNTAVVRQAPVLGNRPALVSAVTAKETSPAAVELPPEDEEDPDFEQAIQIQQRANNHLTKKQYKSAIEEYTAALFLVPDDIHLSPDLHLGRAHALNGSRRHESARNDCFLAIKLNPSPAAYSTLAKSLFYMREYGEAVDAFEKCQRLLPEGESLGMFDQAYLKKAQAALEEEEYSLKKAGTVSGKSTPKIVPKLPPPRFVPREQALQASPHVPPMPKKWPQQSLKSATFLCGEERVVAFASEALGIKLNRGSDGVVRVLQVTPAKASSPFIRQGDLRVGDVVREAAGVDLRRPITNIMWGDTVALIKLAPRPITMIVAEELSPLPPAVRQEQERELAKLPSPNNGEEAVVSPVRAATGLPAIAADQPTLLDTQEEEGKVDRNLQLSNELIPGDEPSRRLEKTVCEREKEERMLGGDVLFLRDDRPVYSGWDSLRWMSYSGVRRVCFCEPVYRLVEREKKGLFWAKKEIGSEERRLAIYEEPALILVLRRPNGVDELSEILDLDPGSEIENEALSKFWIAESVVDPSSAKLRLSSLTSVVASSAERTALESCCCTLITPSESISLSVRNSVDGDESGMILETTALELACSRVLSAANAPDGPDNNVWKHQLILGTLQSFVVSGNLKALKSALHAACEKYGEGNVLPREVIDKPDDKGYSALYFACVLAMPGAVQILIEAGADASISIDTDGSTLAHVCARNLDASSVSALFDRANEKLDPNAYNALGRSPMFTAIAEGRNVDSNSFGKFLISLKKYGGRMNAHEAKEAITLLSQSLRHADLKSILQHCPFRFPLHTESSLGALYGYPVHQLMALIRTLMVKETSCVVGCVATLLDHGFEPNERMEIPFDSASAMRYVGHTPLQVLASVASKLGEVAANDVAMRKLVSDVACCVVAKGGRPAIEAPPPSRKRSVALISPPIATSHEKPWGPQLSSQSMIDVLGGKSRLDHAKSFFQKLPEVNATALAIVYSDTRSNIPSTSLPGGNDELSCAICWKMFGTILNRQHRCRLSRRYVCDECSTKRIVDASGAHRVSDGQYLLACADSFKEKARTTVAPSPPQTSSCSTVGSVNQQARQKRLEEDSTNRETLFSGMLEQASSIVFGEETRAAKQGLNSSLNETRDALNARGQKLDSLAEKSAQMADASANFSRMATELARKQEGGFFW